MKITFKKLFYLLAFISFSLGAKAQYSAVPDTTRFSIGLDGGFPQGNLADSYAFGAGGSLQVDYPLNEKFYVTLNAGYDSYFPNNNNISGNPEAIAGVKLPNMNVAPLKLGIKYFLIRTFYIQAEAGETLLLNKSTVYGLYGTSFTYAPQMGILFKFNHKKYLDVGFRYERFQSFYSGTKDNTILGIRAAYAFNLK